MKKELLKALKKSIKAWEGKVLSEKPLEDMVACDLCKATNKLSPKIVCGGCPVAVHTGISNCYNTPFYDARQANSYWAATPKSLTRQTAWRKAARAEVDFLKSLLPTEGE